MQDAPKRMGARSRCWDGRTGFWFDESGEWLASDLQPHFDAIDQAVVSMVAAEYGGFRQRFIAGSLPVTFNERSKPVGLTKEHVYKDEDGDTIHVHKIEEEPHAVIGIKDGDYAYVQPEYSVPLALNVLGYDQPSAEPYAAGSTAYNGHTANRPIPSSQHMRDAHVAEAIDLLIGADIFDQRTVANKAADELLAKARAEKDAEDAAKRAAEYAKYKQESYDRTKVAYADAIRDQIASGIDATSAAKVQAALSAYETARRKVEGLPN